MREQIGTFATGRSAFVGQEEPKEDVFAKPTDIQPANLNEGANATPQGIGLSFTQDPNDTRINELSQSLINSYDQELPDPKKVRSNVLNRFQGEVDSLERAKAEQKARLTSSFNQTEQEQSNANRAIQSRRNLLGSTFGDADTNRIVSSVRGQRDEQLSATENQFEVAKQSLLSQARTLAETEIENKRNAFRTGAQATIDFVRNKKATAEANANSLVRQALLSDIDLTDPNNRPELLELAGQIGVTPESLVQSYQEQLSAIQAAQAVEDRKRLVEDREFELDAIKEDNLNARELAELNLNISKENNLNAREAAKLNFDITKFQQELALNTQKVEAEIAKINNDIKNGGSANQILDDSVALKLGLPPGSTRADAVKAMAQTEQTTAQTSLEQVQSTLSDVFHLKFHSGLNSAVGINAAGRDKYSFRDRFGATSEFIGKIDNLTKNLTIEKLLEAKASGVTFGALSEEELKLVAESASTINSWRITDSDGNTTGFKIDEGSFKRALEEIETKLKKSEATLRQKLEGFAQRDAEFEQQNGFIGPVQGGSEGTDFFNGNQVKGTRQTAKPLEPISIDGKKTIARDGTTPYLQTLGTVTGPNGSKYWKWGLDVDTKKGDKVLSPVSGEIIGIKKASQTGGFGNQVRIKADDGRVIWFSHFDAIPDVPVGTRIVPGQVIALGGNSGNTYSTSGGDGSHVDITMPKPGGGYYTAPEVQAYLNQFKV